MRPNTPSGVLRTSSLTRGNAKSFHLILAFPSQVINVTMKKLATKTLTMPQTTPPQTETFTVRGYSRAYFWTGERFSSA